MSLTLITWECLCSKIREVVTSTAEKGSACKQCTAGQENIEAAHKPCVGSLPGEALAQCAGCVGLVLVVVGFDNLASVQTQGIFRHSKTANILPRKVELM